jgi:hypothetical protein
MSEVQKTNGEKRSGKIAQLPGGKTRPGLARATCPVCQSPDHSDKVSNVVRSGRGKLTFGNGETARYETELAQLLEEPPRPRAVPILHAALDAIPPLLALAGVLLVLALLRGQDYVAVPERALEVARNIGLAWFGVLIPGVLLLRYAQGRLDLERQLPAWVVAHRRWTALYYCSRDDAVFSPILNAVAAPEEIRGMLYVATSPQPEVAHEAAGPVALPEGGK